MLFSKLCKLHFSNNNIIDAVSQFDNHVKTFRRAVGMAEKVFEHWAWLSRQYVYSFTRLMPMFKTVDRYEVFAQLLEQHAQLIDAENKKYFPGYYYHVLSILTL